MTRDAPPQAPEPMPVPPPPPPPTGRPFEPPEPPPSGGVVTGPPSKPSARRGCLIAMLMLVLLALGVGCALLFAARELRASQSNAAALSEVGDDLAAVADVFAEVGGAWGEVEDAGADGLGSAAASFTAEAEPRLDDAQALLSEAQATVAGLDGSPMKDALEDALAEVELGVQAAKGLVTAVALVAPVAETMTEVGADLDEADALLASAIDKSNADDYAAAAKDADRAKDLYDSAVARLESLAAEQPDAEVDKLIAIVKISREQVELTRRAIEYADAGNFGKYAELVERFDELSGEIAEAPLPTWVDDPSLLLADAKAAYGQVMLHAEKARAAFTLAEERYQAGQY